MPQVAAALCQRLRRVAGALLSRSRHATTANAGAVRAERDGNAAVPVSAQHGRAGQFGEHAAVGVPVLVFGADGDQRRSRRGPAQELRRARGRPVVRHCQHVDIQAAGATQQPPLRLGLDIARQQQRAVLVVDSQNHRVLVEVTSRQRRRRRAQDADLRLAETEAVAVGDLADRDAILASGVDHLLSRRSRRPRANEQRPDMQ